MLKVSTVWVQPADARQRLAIPDSASSLPLSPFAHTEAYLHPSVRIQAICRHTLSSLYSSFLCLTLDAVQDSIQAFAEWRAYLSDKLVQDIAHLTGQVR